VKNQTGFKAGSNDNFVAALATEGGAVSRGRTMLVEPPPFHIQGAASKTRFRLVGSYDPAEARHVRHVADQIVAHLRDDAPLTARRVLESDEAADLDPDDLNALRIRVAAGLLYDGANKAALVLAEASITGDDDDALWTAGLAAYRLHQNDKAARYFMTVAERDSDPWSRSAAAFWVARALTADGDAKTARHWLADAATHKGTFYGMLAQRSIDDADAVKRDTTAHVQSAAYAVPRWKPQNGFTVDPALIFAVMRQESKFDPQAQSNAGAIGLMQIMPATAGQVMQRQADWETELLNPETNMDIGQRYIRTLLQSDGVSNNLIRMAVAYNGGPSALDRGRRFTAETDALMYLETIPAGETKGFAEQVLANYWNYRVRLGEDTASLSDMAAGKWPLYQPVRAKPVLVADAR
jgi:soluble lytic murein transglycosylase-like protein